MNATHNIRVDCPVCDKGGAVPVTIETWGGLRATHDSPAEPPSFEIETPEQCPDCGEEFTDEAISHIERSAEAWLKTPPEDA